MFMRNKFAVAIVEVMTKNFIAPSKEDIRKELEFAMNKASTIHTGSPMGKRARIKYADRKIELLNSQTKPKTNRKVFKSQDIKKEVENGS